MNFFDEASRINQSILAIDKIIYILDTELNNTESELKNIYVTLECQ